MNPPPRSDRTKPVLNFHFHFDFLPRLFAKASICCIFSPPISQSIFVYTCGAFPIALTPDP
jgi:hypothetical protein